MGYETYVKLWTNSVKRYWFRWNHSTLKPENLFENPNIISSLSRMPTTQNSKRSIIIDTKGWFAWFKTTFSYIWVKDQHYNLTIAFERSSIKESLFHPRRWIIWFHMTNHLANWYQTLKIDWINITVTLESAKIANDWMYIWIIIATKITSLYLA